MTGCRFKFVEPLFRVGLEKITESQAHSLTGGTHNAAFYIADGVQTLFTLTLPHVTCTKIVSPMTTGQWISQGVGWLADGDVTARHQGVSALRTRRRSAAQSKGHLPDYRTQWPGP